MELKQEQALLIEDELLARHAAGAALRDLGYDVHTAVDGVEGLALLRGGLQPSIILIDLYMPKLDAVGFRRAQLTQPHLASIPTVVLTATQLAGVVAGSIGLPLLQKPFSRAELTHAIEDASGRLGGGAKRSAGR